MMRHGPNAPNMTGGNGGTPPVLIPHQMETLRWRWWQPGNRAGGGGGGAGAAGQDGTDSAPSPEVSAFQTAVGPTGLLHRWWWTMG